MSLTLEEMTQLCRRTAREIDPRLTVVAVLSKDREAGRMELLITLEGCHQEPCSVIVNLPHADRGGVEQALRAELANTLREHAGGARTP